MPSILVEPSKFTIQLEGLLHLSVTSKVVGTMVVSYQNGAVIPNE